MTERDSRSEDCVAQPDEPSMLDEEWLRFAEVALRLARDRSPVRVEAAGFNRRDIPAPRWLAGEHLPPEDSRQVPKRAVSTTVSSPMAHRSTVSFGPGPAYSETVPHHLLKAAIDVRHARSKPCGSRKAVPRRNHAVLTVTSPSKSHFLSQVRAEPRSRSPGCGDSAQPGVADLIRLALGERVTVLFRPPSEWLAPWSCERAVVPSYRFALHPRIAGSATRILDAVGPAPPDSPRFLYVSRRDAWTYRMMLNEDLVEEMLCEMGFVPLQLGALSETAIIHHFSAARAIVGPQGAGLYNAIFSKPGTQSKLARPTISVRSRAGVP